MHYYTLEYTHDRYQYGYQIYNILPNPYPFHRYKYIYRYRYR